MVTTIRHHSLITFPFMRMVLAALAVGLVVASIQAGVVGLGAALALKSHTATAILYYLLYTVTGAGAALLTYRYYVRLIEARPVNELASNHAWREGGAGFLIGGGLMALTVGVLWLLGAYQVLGINNALVLPAALANDLTGAVVEELLLRAILFRILAEWIGVRWALLLSALLFAGLHLLNPAATLFSAVAVGGGATLLLCAAYLSTRRVWLAVGIHAGWDFAQGGLFGVGTTVAGEVTQGWLQSQTGGPAWLTGGALGVEASVVALLLTMIVGVYLLRARSGQFSRLTQDIAS